MLSSEDVQRAAEVEKRSLLQLRFDAPTLILNCVISVLEAPPYGRPYDPGRALGGSGYGFDRSQMRVFAEIVRDCMRSKGLTAEFPNSFPVSAWLKSTTIEGFVVWLIDRADWIEDGPAGGGQ